MSGQDERLSIEDARRVATLSRLALTEQELEHHRRQLSAVLELMQVLQELELEGVEPLAHPLDATDRLDADEPRPAMATAVLMKLSPATDPPYVKVPKVIE